MTAHKTKREPCGHILTGAAHCFAGEEFYETVMARVVAGTECGENSHFGRSENRVGVLRRKVLWEGETTAPTLEGVADTFLGLLKVQ